MAKTADTIENTAFPTYDASKTTDQFRAVAEKGVEQSKEAYAKFASGAETTQKALQSTFETAKAIGSELSLKTIAAMRANAEAAFSHLEVLLGVSLPSSSNSRPPSCASRLKKPSSRPRNSRP